MRCTPQGTQENIMKVGDTIRTTTGRVGIVLSINGTSLWTTIDCGCWVHITKCYKVAA